MSTEHPVERLLLDLGDTPEAIAKALQAKGIQGRPQSQRHCVLAMYLAQQGHRVKFDHTRAELESGGRWVLPDHLSEFVQGFDCRRYPALILSERGAT